MRANFIRGLVFVMVVAALGLGCQRTPHNDRGDDAGATRGPLSATSKDLDQPRAKNQTKDDTFNPSRW